MLFEAATAPGPGQINASFDSLICKGIPFSNTCTTHPSSNILQKRLIAPKTIKVKDKEVPIKKALLGDLRKMFCQGCPYLATANVAAWQSLAH
ncbi:hypothetical protein D4R99_03425 [bacterium]|nr:MAG: hypothetical protein D4R99_03425 [bacterium]